jgi:outer membrane murein-binding lipoprotein Lpp
MSESSTVPRHNHQGLDHPTPSDVGGVENFGTTKDSKEDLEREKLRLEIAELRRSTWRKPSVIVPITATLVTLALSQYLGVFDVERKRVELSSREAEMKRQELGEDLDKLEKEKRTLVTEKTALQGEKGALLREKNALEHRKEGLGLDVDKLESEVKQFKLDIKKLQVAEEHARSDAEKAKSELERTRNILARPDINITTKVLVWEKQALIYMTNRGRGTADVRIIRSYVDGQLMQKGPSNQPFRPTLHALGLFDSWIRWYWALRTLEPGEMTPIFMIEPGQFTEDRAAQLENAIERLGLEVCYCSALNECYWATLQRPAVTTASCNVQPE